MEIDRIFGDGLRIPGFLIWWTASAMDRKTRVEVFRCSYILGSELDSITPNAFTDFKSKVVVAQDHE